MSHSFVKECAYNQTEWGVINYTQRKNPVDFNTEYWELRATLQEVSFVAKTQEQSGVETLFVAL